MKIIWILAICLAVRLVGLNQSLWLDEAISVQTAKNYSYGEIINKFSPHDFHPPLYYLTLKSWITIFGDSEISVRMPSVVFTLITVYIVYLLAGTNAALLVGLNPLLVYYSQEARMYAMVTMLMTIAIWAMVKNKYWIFALFSFLSFLTFYGSIFLIVVMLLRLLIQTKYKEFLISAVGIVAAYFLIKPLLTTQMSYSKEVLVDVKNWSLVLGKANIKNLLMIPMKFTSGRISFTPKPVYYFVSGIFTFYIFLKTYKRNIYGYFFWGTLIVGSIFSIFTPMLQYFRFLYLVPILGLMIKKDRVALIGFTIFSGVYLMFPTFYREDWKSATKDLPNRIYMIGSFADPVKYYRDEVEVIDIREKVTDKEITVIPYGENIHGVDHQKILTNLGYKLSEQNNFREITTETWHLIY